MADDALDGWVERAVREMAADIEWRPAPEDAEPPSNALRSLAMYAAACWFLLLGAWAAWSWL